VKAVTHAEPVRADLDCRGHRSSATTPNHRANANTITPAAVRNSTTRRCLLSVRTRCRSIATT